MRQCLLRQDNDVYKLAWIPEKFAHEGNVIDLKEGRVWDGPWRVERVYSVSLDLDKIEMSVRQRFPSLEEW